MCLGTSVFGITLSSKDGPRPSYSATVWINLVCTTFAVFFLVLAGTVAAAGAKVAEGRLNDLGEDVRVSAVAGTDWVVLAWAGVALMVVVLIYWVSRVIKLMSDKKKLLIEMQQREEEAQRQERERNQQQSSEGRESAVYYVYPPGPAPQQNHQQ